MTTDEQKQIEKVGSNIDGLIKWGKVAAAIAGIYFVVSLAYGFIFNNRDADAKSTRIDVDTLQEQQKDMRREIDDLKKDVNEVNSGVKELLRMQREQYILKYGNRQYENLLKDTL